MIHKSLLLTIFVWLLTTLSASAHEPCGNCSRSPFRITHMRTITISNGSSYFSVTEPVRPPKRFRRSIHQAARCSR